MKLVMSSLLVAFASSAIATAAPAAADPVPAKVEVPSAERLDLARRFVSLTVPADRYMEMTRAAFMGSTIAQLDGLEDDSDYADAEQKLGKVFDKIDPLMRAQLPRLLEAYAQSYAREYSGDELQQLVAFAGSPAGRHYISRRDFVDEDEAVQDATRNLWEATMPVIQEFQKEMCAEKAAQRVAMGDTKAKCPLAAAAETQAG